MRSPCYLCIYVPSTNFLMPIYEPRYIYHDTSAQLNGLLYKYIQSICVSVCTSPYRC
jgi:hypothetical protein